MEEKMYTK